MDRLKFQVENSVASPPPLSEIAYIIVSSAKTRSHLRCCHILKQRWETPLGHLAHRPTQILLCKSDGAAALSRPLVQLQSMGLSILSCSWHSRPRMAFERVLGHSL